MMLRTRLASLVPFIAPGLLLALVLACSDRGHVVVLTEEPTAVVWVDGVETGAIGPEGFEIEGGPHTVEVIAKGYHPWLADIEVTSDHPTVLQVELVGEAGYLVVRSNVSGDTVYVDDTPLGPSGPHSHELASGLHVVRVERPGYTPFVQEVELASEETLVVQASLVGLGGRSAGVGSGPPPQAGTTTVVPVPVPGFAPGYRPYRYYGAPRVPVPRGPRPRLPRLP